MNWLLVILLAVGAYFLYQGRSSTEEWTGVFYPNRSNLTVHQIVGNFDTLDMCRSELIGRANSQENPNNADWECGLDCRPYEGDPEMLICEKTER